MSILEEMIKKNKITKATISKEMISKEFNVGKKDIISAKKSFDDENYKWATIQAYYAIFHIARSLLFKKGYREKSHIAFKKAIFELYIKNNILSESFFRTLDRGMELREIADYKESYSKNTAQKLIDEVIDSINIADSFFKKQD